MKRALLVGINYIGTPYRLNGCINDVVNVESFLKTLGYTEFIKYTDDTRDASKLPTRNNILIGFAILFVMIKIIVVHHNNNSILCSR